MASEIEKEKAHYNLHDNLENATEVASQHLNIVHIIATGLDYYLTQAYKSAPSLERAELYSSFTAGPDGSFSCQGDSWEGDTTGVHFMQVVAAGFGAQWTQRWFNGEDVKKHATYNG